MNETERWLAAIHGEVQLIRTRVGCIMLVMVLPIILALAVAVLTFMGVAHR